MILEHIGDAYLISWHGTTISGNIHWAGCDWWRWNCTVHLWAACLWYNKRSSYLMLEWWFPWSYSTGSICSLCDFFYTITCLRHLKIPLFFKTSLSKDLYFVWWVTSASCFVLCFQTQGKDLLVVLSDSGKLSFLTFSLEMHRLAWFNSLFFFFLC